MKWSSGGSKQRIDKKVWHKWFAWFPVCVKNYGGGHKEMVWLEHVRRKGIYRGYSGWDYKYKL